MGAFALSARRGASGMKDHEKKPPRAARAISEATFDEKMLDAAIEQSFPASDPLSTNPTSIGAPRRSPRAHDAPRSRPRATQGG
jgi:hypothetical protein